MKKISLLLLAVLATLFTNCEEKYPELQDGLYAEIVTNKGTAIAELFFKTTPLTVANFVSLAEGTNTAVDSTYRGKKFYNGTVFHRVIKDFMIQGGDPLGNGTGDPGYRFPDEIVDSLQHDSKGILSMANSGPATNGSQFFITLKETPWLNGRHTVFGEIVNGQDVVDSIGNVKTEARDKPATEIKIQEVNIIRKGKEAKNFDAAKTFDEKIKAFETEEEEKRKKAEEIQKKTAEKYNELKSKAKKFDSGLEMVILEEGEGPKPNQGDMVELYYQGFFEDGKVFDTNKAEAAKELGVYDEQRAADPRGYAPITMPYSPDASMIAGFKEGVQQMKVGDRAVLYIPSHLGYGEQGRGPIPSGANLIFEIDLIGIQGSENNDQK